MVVNMKKILNSDLLDRLLGHLLGDPFFLLGVGLFFLALFGLILILKTLQKKSLSEIIIEEEKPKEKQKPFQKIEQSKETVSYSLNNDKVVLEVFSKRLGQIEETLQTISEQLNKLKNKESQNMVLEELKANLENLKNIPGQDNMTRGEILDISTKVDKIYQVMVSLSQSE